MRAGSSSVVVLNPNGWSARRTGKISRAAGVGGAPSTAWRAALTLFCAVPTGSEVGMR